MIWQFFMNMTVKCDEYQYSTKNTRRFIMNGICIVSGRSGIAISHSPSISKKKNFDTKIPLNPSFEYKPDYAHHHVLPSHTPELVNSTLQLNPLTWMLPHNHTLTLQPETRKSTPRLCLFPTPVLTHSKIHTNFLKTAKLYQISSGLL